MRKRLGFWFILAILAATPAWADFAAGKRAALQGDYATAYQEWRSAAEDGDAESQFLLGLLYREGRGVAQDYAQSAEWLRQAADLGHHEAQFYLARAYREGLGVGADDGAAATLFRAAAEQGHADAAFSLGLMHRRGHGVAKDDLEAARWYLAAAGRGHGEARFTLGAVSEEGKGIARDVAWAYAWYVLAAESGVELAEVLSKRLERRMTPAQLERGRRLAQEWREVPPEFEQVEQRAGQAAAAARPAPVLQPEMTSAAAQTAPAAPVVAPEPVEAAAPPPEPVEAAPLPPGPLAQIPGDGEPGWDIPLPAEVAAAAGLVPAPSAPPLEAGGAPRAEAREEATMATGATAGEPAPEIAVAVLEAAPPVPPAPPVSDMGPGPHPAEDDETDAVEREAVPELDADVPYRVRLAAFRTVARTNKGWEILSEAHPDLLGGLRLSVERVDHGAEKGVFFRLEVGPLGGPGAARDLCAKLKRREVDCLVVRP